MKINKTKTFSSAFTLIELLVVIAIIAILASIALPVFSSVQERSKQTKDLSNGKQIALALKQFATDSNGEFPNKVYSTCAGDYSGCANLLVAASPSNEAFRWLLPVYLRSEDILLSPAPRGILPARTTFWTRFTARQSLEAHWPRVRTVTPT